MYLFNGFDPSSRSCSVGTARVLRTLLLFAILCGAAPVSSAASAVGDGGWLYDSDYLRGYIGLRWGIAIPSKKEFASGFSFTESSPYESPNAQIGVDLSRYLSLELELNYYETDYNATGYPKTGEITIFSTIPQVRLKYPMMDGRLVPYILGGVGSGVVEISDNTAVSEQPGVPSLSGRKRGLAGTFGIGADYYVAENLSLSLEAKQLFFSQTLDEVFVGDPGSASSPIDVSLDATILSFGLRMYFPQAAAASAFPGVSWKTPDPDGVRGYVALRFGLWHLNDVDIAPGLRATNGADQQQLSALSVGANLNRYLSAEFAVDYYETEVDAVNFGQKLNELSVWAFLAQVRGRYPMLDHRLVPYAVAGVGLGFTEFNDGTLFSGEPQAPRTEAQSFAPAGTLGVGVDWFVADNIALEAEFKYLFMRQDLVVDGQSHGANLDTLLLGLGFRVFFP